MTDTDKSPQAGEAAVEEEGMRTILQDGKKFGGRGRQADFFENDGHRQ